MICINLYKIKFVNNFNFWIEKTDYQIIFNTFDTYSLCMIFAVKSLDPENIFVTSVYG